LANNFRSIAEGKYGESGRERGIEAARSDFPYAAAPAPPFGFWTLWLKTTSTQKLSSGTAARDPRTQIWEELGVGGASWLWLFVFYLGRRANNAAYAQCFPLRQYSDALPAYPLRF